MTIFGVVVEGTVLEATETGAGAELVVLINNVVLRVDVIVEDVVLIEVVVLEVVVVLDGVDALLDIGVVGVVVELTVDVLLDTDVVLLDNVVLAVVLAVVLVVDAVLVDIVVELCVEEGVEVIVVDIGVLGVCVFSVDVFGSLSTKGSMLKTSSLVSKLVHNCWFLIFLVKSCLTASAIFPATVNSNKALTEPSQKFFTLHFTSWFVSVIGLHISMLRFLYAALPVSNNASVNFLSVIVRVP